MKKLFVLTALSALTLAACSTEPRWRDAQFWQRVDSTSALYLQGPKAQQTLHQNISTCVSDVNELQRLGSIKEAVPADLEAPDQKEMATWDTPQKDGYRYAEHLDYTDFETCMHAHGWERVEHLPYDVSHRARDTWVDTIIGSSDKEMPELHSKSTSVESKDRAPYDNLNE